MNVQDISDFMESEKGKEAMKRFAEKTDNMNKYKNRWIERIKKYLDSVIVPDIEKLLTHDSKISDRLYYRSIDGQSSLIWMVFHTIAIIGDSVELSEYGDFVVEKYLYKGWYFDVISGQGRFVRIYKK